MKQKKTLQSEPRQPSAPAMNVFEKGLFGLPFGKIHTLIPGLIFLLLLGWMSVWLSGFIGIVLLGFSKSPLSPIMIVLLGGIAANNIFHLPAVFHPGFKFAVNKLLRLGIVFLGIRLSIFSVFELGAIGVPIVVGCISSALIITTCFNKWLKQPRRLGTLIAVGTSICGVSAIVAASPAIDAKEEETAYAVAVITVFGLVATIVYPFIAFFLFGGNPVDAGLWLGTAIHDTSQVAGAAMIFADVWDLPLGLDVAMVTKLVRNAFMVVVIPFMAFLYANLKPGWNTAGK